MALPKRYGSILRGLGPPAPGAGVVGDLYIDASAWGLYEKRAVDLTDPWGHYLFIVPAAYRTGLKYFGPSAPADEIGVLGDYCLLWGGYANYGMYPSTFGPKQSTGWPENGNGGSLPIAASTITPIGLLGEGAALPESNSTQLIMLGLSEEVIAPIPVTAGVGEDVQQVGLLSNAAPMVGVVLNPLYTAQDTHNVA